MESRTGQQANDQVIREDTNSLQGSSHTKMIETITLSKAPGMQLDNLPPTHTATHIDNISQCTGDRLPVVITDIVTVVKAC